MKSTAKFGWIWDSAELLLLAMALFILIPPIPSIPDQIDMTKQCTVALVLFAGSRVITAVRRRRHPVYCVLEVLLFAVFAYTLGYVVSILTEWGATANPY